MERVKFWVRPAVAEIRLFGVTARSLETTSYFLARALAVANSFAPEARPQIMRMMNWVSAERAKINKETV